jgi:hypothetical protein
MAEASFKDKLKAVSILGIWLFSILFVFGLPSELKIIHSLKNAKPLKVQLNTVRLVKSNCGRPRYTCKNVYVTAIDPSTKKPIDERIRIEPGRVGYNIGPYSLEKKDLEKYKVGQIHNLYMANNGIYYLSKGGYFPYLYLFIFSIVWLCGNAIIIIKRS